MSWDLLTWTACTGMKVSDFCVLAVPGTRTEWSEIKDRVDLAAVATNLLGPAAKRQGPRLLWPCPFRDDHDPSFQVDLNRKTWRCWVCAIGGDAAELVKKVNKCDFPTAVKFLADRAGVASPLRGATWTPIPLEIQPPPSFLPARSESGPRTPTRTGAKSTRGELTGFATNGDATSR